MTLVDEVAGAVVARVNAIPARFTRNIEQRATLQREVDEALAEVADRIEKLGGPLSARAVTILRPTRKRPPHDWARENRVYPLSSGRPGPKDPALTPYMIPFMRAFDDPNYNTVAFVCGGMGKTCSVIDVGGFEAGFANRRLKGFVPSRAHLNTLIAAAGPDITARARFLVRNNGYAANAIESWAGNVVGAGIKPST